MRNFLSVTTFLVILTLFGAMSAFEARTQRQSGPNKAGGRVALLAASPLLAQERSAFRPRADLPVDFEPLRNPQFVPAAKADFLKDSDRVLGVSENGISKAYRTDILGWHHITHDQLGKLPVLVTW